LLADRRLTLFARGVFMARIVVVRGICLFAVLAASVGASPARAAERPLATYRFTAGKATFGFPLPKGAAWGGLTIGTLVTQTDTKTVWEDGSIRFAVLSADVPAAGEYPINAAAPALGATQPSPPAASVEIVVNGTRYVSTLAGATADVWLSGPVAREFRARTTFSPTPPGPASRLSVWWDVRSYASGGHVVSVTLDNTQNHADANAVEYGVNVIVNGATLFSKPSGHTPGRNTMAPGGENKVISPGHGLQVGDYVRLTSAYNAIRRVDEVIDENTVLLNAYMAWIPAGTKWEKVAFVQPYMTRWRKRFVVGMTEAEITPDFDPWYSAKVIPRYMASIDNPTRPVNTWQFDVLGLGAWRYPMLAPGDREELALFPAWAARYFVFRTQALRNYVLLNGELGGSFSTHITETDGTIVRLDERPDFATGNAAGDSQTDGNNGPAGGGPLNFGKLYEGEKGAAHQGSVALVPYLLSGDRYFLDELKFWANYGVTSWLWARNGAQGLVTSQQLRGVAWAVRDLAHVVAFAPDNDQDRDYFSTLLTNNLRDLDAKVAQEQDPLGSVSFWHDNLLPGGGEIAPFMQSFAVWVLDHLDDLGFRTDGQTLRVKLARYYNSLANAAASGDYNFYDIGAYRIKVKDASGNFFNSYKQLWSANFSPTGFYPVPVPRPPQGPSQGTYAPNLWVIFLTASKLRLPNADQHLARLMQTQEGGYRLVDELNLRPHYALASSVPGARTDSGLSAPTGLRIVVGGQ
jgi:hypothetical protein